MSNINNKKEYLDANQDDITKKTNSFFDSLPEEEQKKKKAVDDACKILIDNNVLFYMFPYLPASFSEEKNMHNVVYQWNSLNHFSEFDENEYITEKTKELFHEYWDSLLYTIYSMSKSIYKLEETKDTNGEKQNPIIAFARLVYDATNRVFERLK